ncbi:MgtC/SapB family protein [Xylophilus sp. Leaf220]|uniref:MgtC/SapB family protein n=1 Tax=Xylophilus sp. Leaf220 TaxID=1735686 RepID=UPI0006FDF257|nr:MgtC/SapB family protein [Xylophilus sp. Leaf220]KQM79783.1 methyltransferase [Xylophilus sp. Leaf220]
MAAGWWETVGRVVEQEFADIGDPERITRLVLRLGMAALLGGLLGLERERSGKSAGIRTHMLVSMGAALFVLVTQQAGVLETDVSRVVQGIVAGVGFLGAGAILKSRGGDQVKGLTTAAGIWLTAAIGLSAGLGQEVTAVLSTVLAILVLSLESAFGRLGNKLRE